MWVTNVSVEAAFAVLPCDSFHAHLAFKNQIKNEAIISLQSEKTGKYTTVFLSIFSKVVIFKGVPWDF